MVRPVLPQRPLCISTGSALLYWGYFWVGESEIPDGMVATAGTGGLTDLNLECSHSELEYCLMSGRIEVFVFSRKNEQHVVLHLCKIHLT